MAFAEALAALATAATLTLPAVFGCALGLDRTKWTFGGPQTNASEQQIHEELAEFVGQFYDDPLGFVINCYPWGEPGGPLEYHDGPDAWQREALEDLGRQVRARKFDGHTAVDPVRQAVSSGHGVGKSTYQAWIVDWIMSTRPRCRGTITANNATQLDTKTWAAITFWTKLCITAPWFEINTTRLYFKGQREDWFCAPQSCKKENSEAFAGQHAATSTSFYIFDEDSGIEDVIHEVAEGGLTDGEPMIFRFGNCTRSSGSFYRACFGNERHIWNPVIVDSRTSKFSNKKTIEEWRLLYGEDSDFFRVRVRGLPPRASDLQFIGTDVVSTAQKNAAVCLSDDPLIAALDMARGGADNCVIRFRRGNDARSIPPIRIPGEQAKDSTKIVTVALDVLTKDYASFYGGNGGRPLKVASFFVDATGGSVGGPIADRLRQLGHEHVIDVQFGGECPDPKILNMRAYMWSKLRDWLPRGAIDESPILESDLTGPGYHHDKSDRLVLEAKEHMKQRGIASPDDGDALAMTFAYPVSPTLAKQASAASNYRPPSRWG